MIGGIAKQHGGKGKNGGLTMTALLIEVGGLVALCFFAHWAMRRWLFPRLRELMQAAEEEGYQRGLATGLRIGREVLEEVREHDHEPHYN